MSAERGPTGADAGRTAAERDRRIRDVVASLGSGEVVSYGDVAADAGVPGRSRLVGHLLALGGQGLPWWRVVTSTGRLVPGSEAEQARLLRAEGVRVEGGRVREAPRGRFARRGGGLSPDRPPTA